MIQLVLLEYNRRGKRDEAKNRQDQIGHERSSIPYQNLELSILVMGG